MGEALTYSDLIGACQGRCKGYQGRSSGNTHIKEDSVEVFHGSVGLVVNRVTLEERRSISFICGGPSAQTRSRKKRKRNPRHDVAWMKTLDPKTERIDFH